MTSKTPSTDSTVSSIRPFSSSSGRTDVSVEETEKVWDVIIIGAGQAGMAAVHRIIFEQHNQNKRPEKSLRLLVLEASDHIGGRTRNYDVATGKTDTVSDSVIEMGGAWLSPEHTATLTLCKEHLGLQVFRASFQNAQTKHSCASHENVDNRPNESVVDFPWWFLGPDYSDAEMNNLKRLVVHTSTSMNGTKVFAVSNAEEFLHCFDAATQTQLETVGDIIDSDATALIEESDNSTQKAMNVWDLPAIGKIWHEFDSASTAEKRNFLSTEQHSLRSQPYLTNPNARNILRGLVHDKNAEEPDKVSYLYNLISWRGSNSAGPDMEYRVRGGTQAIPLTIASKLVEQQHGHEVDLRLDCQVVSVRSSSNGLGEMNRELNVTVAGGVTFRSRTLLVTGSPASLRRIDFGPDQSSLLPREQRDLLSLDSSPMGRCTKFCAIFENGPWWRKHNLQGDIIASGLPKALSFEVESSQSPQNKELVPLFPYSYDVSPLSQDVGVLCCFVEGAAFDKLHEMSWQEQKETLTSFLRLSFQDFVDESKKEQENLWEPDDFVSFDWGPMTPFVGGAYTSYFPPRTLSRHGIWEAYRQKEKAPNVFWAGADYHTGFGNGYIEGAIRSGQDAADKIMARLYKEDTVHRTI